MSERMKEWNSERIKDWINKQTDKKYVWEEANKKENKTQICAKKKLIAIN